MEESKGKAVKGHHSSESVVDCISDMYTNTYESNTNINTYKYKYIQMKKSKQSRDIT